MWICNYTFVVLVLTNINSQNLKKQPLKAKNVMIAKPNNLIFLFLILIAFTSCGGGHDANEKDLSNAKNNDLALVTLEKDFENPPDSIQTSVYWYWISNNISKEGVIKDLESMKKVGINRAFIGNIGLPDVPYGDVKLLSNEWWEVMHTALKTATDLNIEIGIFNSPGWSQSGGPWIKPEEAMRYLTSSELDVEGPKNLNVKLKKPAKEFQDVKVIAFRQPKDYGTSISDFDPKITSKQIKDPKKLFDGDSSEVVDLQQGAEVSLEVAQPFMARSVVFYPAHREMKIEVEIQALKNGNYETIKSGVIDRSNEALNTGFNPYAPAVLTLPATQAKSFRIKFLNTSSGSALTGIKLSSSPKVEDYAEKTLAKMFPTPLPYWEEYQWPQQPDFTEKNLMIAPSGVMDISDKMEKDGTLNWDVPEGDWVIMRTGMTPTGVVNSPAAPEGTGLEVDKMSKKHIEKHFDAFLGEIIKRIPPEDRRTWKVTVEDSYETGGQNWTDGMLKKFEDKYGYSALPYIPVMQGKVVGSEEQSDRFLWDLRRFIADEIAYKYVAGLREVSHKHGLHTWLENYGHWGFPGEFLMYGGQSDEVAGEFWSEGDLGNIENRAASSAAHIYGKTKVSAESFTAGGKAYARYPAQMKQRGDRFFTEGINNTLLHLFIQQPYEDMFPGVNAPFGNEFNRKNTWFDDMDLFIDYLKRCNMMLQQGKYVADVAYFIGEDAPKMTGVRDPELPKGYSFDYINAEVIENRLVVKDGKLVLPDGMSYRILVLPKLETMRPELLKKIQQLVDAGAVVLGPRPDRSPSLENYPDADKEVREMASQLWGDIDGKRVKNHKYGSGMVMNGMDMQEALNSINVLPDYQVKSNDSTLFIHRRLKENDADIYFVSNQSEKPIAINPQFRLTGKKPELWQPTHGLVRDLPDYSFSEKTTSVPLKLAPLESAFIVFRKPAHETDKMNNAENFPDPEKTTELNGPWEVVFDAEMRGPKQAIVFDELVDWGKRPEEGIKYYSGTAVYHKSFDAEKAKKGERIWLDLGKVIAMAKVKVNGVDVGGVWTPPYRVDITKAVKKGKNELEISVVNTWVNRLIGDQNLPESERKTSTFVNIYSADSALEPSGLLGSVKLEIINY